MLGAPGVGVGLGRRWRALSGIFRVPEDETSTGDTTELDQGTIVFDGGFSDAPDIGNNGGGKQVSGTSDDFAKFLFSIGVPVANTVYTMTYDPDFSALSNTGKQAMVGFGFMQGNSYHFAGLKGDGATGLNANKAYGSNFKKLEATTEVDGGVAAHGTQAGPNWLRITIAEDGTTYTLSTSSDGSTWAEEFTDAVPTPLSNSTDATDFGIAIYLDAADKGAFTVDITVWEQGEAVATDPEISNVVLLASFDGTDGDTSFSDESPSAHGGFTFHNSMQLDNAQSTLDYATSALYIAGSGQWVNALSMATSPDFAIGTNDFAFEMFVYWGALATQNDWFFHLPGAVELFQHTDDEVRFRWSEDGTGFREIAGGSAGLTAGAWHYIAVTRNGNLLEVGLNGSIITSVADADESIFTSTSSLYIGNNNALSRAIGWTSDAWLQEFRFTNGAGRDITVVPTVPFPRS